VEHPPDDAALLSASETDSCTSSARSSTASQVIGHPETEDDAGSPTGSPAQEQQQHQQQQQQHVQSSGQILRQAACEQDQVFSAGQARARAFAEGLIVVEEDGASTGGDRSQANEGELSNDRAQEAHPGAVGAVEHQSRVSEGEVLPKGSIGTPPTHTHSILQGPSSEPAGGAVPSEATASASGTEPCGQEQRDAASALFSSSVLLGPEVVLFAREDFSNLPDAAISPVSSAATSSACTAHNGLPSFQGRFRAGPSRQASSSSLVGRTSRGAPLMVRKPLSSRSGKRTSPLFLGGNLRETMSMTDLGNRVGGKPAAEAFGIREGGAIMSPVGFLLEPQSLVLAEGTPILPQRSRILGDHEASAMTKSPILVGHEVSGIDEEGLGSPAEHTRSVGPLAEEDSWDGLVLEQGALNKEPMQLSPEQGAGALSFCSLNHEQKVLSSSLATALRAAGRPRSNTRLKRGRTCPPDGVHGATFSSGLTLGRLRERAQRDSAERKKRLEELRKTQQVTLQAAARLRRIAENTAKRNEDELLGKKNAVDTMTRQRAQEQRGTARQRRTKSSPPASRVTEPTSDDESEEDLDGDNASLLRNPREQHTVGEVVEEQSLDLRFPIPGEALWLVADDDCVDPAAESHVDPAVESRKHSSWSPERADPDELQSAKRRETVSASEHKIGNSPRIATSSHAHTEESLLRGQAGADAECQRTDAGSGAPEVWKKYLCSGRW